MSAILSVGGALVSLGLLVVALLWARREQWLLEQVRAREVVQELDELLRLSGELNSALRHGRYDTARLIAHQVRLGTRSLLARGSAALSPDDISDLHRVSGQMDRLTKSLEDAMIREEVAHDVLRKSHVCDGILVTILGHVQGGALEMTRGRRRA